MKQTIKTTVSSYVFYRKKILKTHRLLPINTVSDLS